MERPASPAAHTTKQASNLADESRAIRGRVHAVVRPRATRPESSISARANPVGVHLDRPHDSTSESAQVR